GVYGKLDAVEFIETKTGILPRNLLKDTAYEPHIVEYKKGKQKKNPCDIIQLVAQVVCLEEMFQTHISSAYLYYKSIHRRVEVPIDTNIRLYLQDTIEKMQEYLKEKTIPNGRFESKCKSCSLINYCMPITNGKSSKKYIMEHLGVNLEKVK
ncbi:MAG: CRISPR-associated protein Cas4, partial [Tissierellia bacterium]|nr:CRISPR-associated protein Cas4 [Tissierellia bacterium]